MPAAVGAVGVGRCGRGLGHGEVAEHARCAVWVAVGFS